MQWAVETSLAACLDFMLAALVPWEQLLQRFLHVLHLPSGFPRGMEWSPLTLGGGRVLRTRGRSALG